MNLVNYCDSDINFLQDACEELRMSEEIVEVPTAIGMKLMVGCYRDRWYNVVLADGRKRLAVLQLRIRPSKRRKLVFEPHSYTRKPYRGNQYAEQMYRWVLDNGFILMAHGDQTPASHNLWAKLALTYKMRLFDTRTNKYTSRLERMYEPDVVMELSLQ